MTQELGNLDPIPLRSIWSHEENDFTPWLADNLDQLSDAVDIELQLVEIEHELPDGRRVDILARDHDDRIVIENQLETSDDDHFVRLLHYGHTTGAKTLLWLAPEFTTLHAETVRWLNSRYKLDLRCIEVSAWRLQDTYRYSVSWSPTPIAPRTPVNTGPSIVPFLDDWRPSASPKFNQHFQLRPFFVGSQRPHRTYFMASYTVTQTAIHGRSCYLTTKKARILPTKQSRRTVMKSSLRSLAQLSRPPTPPVPSGSVPKRQRP